MCLYPKEVDEDGDDAARPLVVIKCRQQQADVRQYEGDLHVQLDHPAKYDYGSPIDTKSSATFVSQALAAAGLYRVTIMDGNKLPLT